MKHFRFILRLTFGAVFIWSGIAKLKDPISFADAVRNFEIVNDPIAPALALLIPWVEVIAGIFTMAGKLWRGSVFTLFLSLVVFTIALAIAWTRGLDISCGCFGGSGAVNYPLMISRNVGLAVMGWLIFKFREMPSPTVL
jgi:putative oxidoreductase